MPEPEVRYCTSEDGVRIAYTVEGHGPPLVISGSMLDTIDVEGTGSREFRETLGRYHTVYRYDWRGAGLSQEYTGPTNLDTYLADLSAVIEQTGSEPCDLIGGSQVAAVYAAMHPDRVAHFVAWSLMPSGPAVARPGAVDSLVALIHSNFKMATRAMADMVCPSGPELDKRITAEAMDALGPDRTTEFIRHFWALDVSEQLARITVPTMIIHRRDNALVPLGAVRAAAALIPDARLVILDGDSGSIYFDHELHLETIISFLGAEQADQDTVTADAAAVRTVLFTDIVGHTEMMSRLGDERGRDVLREHEGITREVLAAHAGTEVKTMGDGFMASFGSVTKAVECAIALQRAFAERESDEPLSVRVGINAGEPIEEDGDLFGATVILASRIAAKAEGGEILVADTVRGLCSGKGFLFADRGEFVAKGFEDPVRVYEVSWRE